MRAFVFLAGHFFDFEKREVTIGGLQTYIRDLAELMASDGFEIEVVQINPAYANGREASFGDFRIVNRQGKPQRIFDEYKAREPEALFVLSTDQMPIKARGVRSIQIQHGIAFDIPGNMIGGFWGKTPLLQLINKTLRCLKNVSRLSQADHTVCVDYNYYNWFRTLGTIRLDQKVTVIPNYAGAALTEAELEAKLAGRQGVRSIVFARRFVDYRGTLMFADVIPQLLARYPKLEITLAGNGPLETELHRRFDSEPRVKFAAFNSAESLEFHRNFDLAVVPTIFSEGTSLSLCEAMAAGCFPVATHVGGMTNILLDSFNGLSVYPSTQALYEGLCQAIDMPAEEFNRTVRNAHATAITTFSRHHWQQAWRKALQSCC